IDLAGNVHSIQRFGQGVVSREFQGDVTRPVDHHAAGSNSEPVRQLRYTVFEVGRAGAGHQGHTDPIGPGVAGDTADAREVAAFLVGLGEPGDHQDGLPVAPVDEDVSPPEIGRAAGRERAYTALKTDARETKADT